MRAFGRSLFCFERAYRGELVMRRRNDDRDGGAEAGATFCPVRGEASRLVNRYYDITITVLR
jgi:hypothetical protein